MEQPREISAERVQKPDYFDIEDIIERIPDEYTSSKEFISQFLEALLHRDQANIRVIGSFDGMLYENGAQDICVEVERLPYFRFEDLENIFRLLDQLDTLLLQKYLLAEKKREKKEKPTYNQFVYTILTTPIALLSNATRKEISDLATFLQRQIEQIRREGIEHTEKNCSLDRTISGVDELSYALVPTKNGEVEGPYICSIAVSREEDTAPLPEIRYGQTGKDEITVYAIQGKKIREHLIGTIIGNQEEILDDVGFVFDQLMHKNFDNYPGVPKIPEDIHFYSIEEQINFLIVWMEKMQEALEEKGALSEDRFYNELDLFDYLQMNGFINFFDTKQRIFQRILAYVSYQDYRKVKKKLNSKFKLDKDASPDIPQVSPEKLVSFATMIKLAHHQGVRRVRVPLNFPLRNHAEGKTAGDQYRSRISGKIPAAFPSTLDKRLETTQRKLVHRMAYELKLEVRTEYDGEVLVLELPDDLETDQPVLQELFSKMEAANEDKEKAVAA